MNCTLLRDLYKKCRKIELGTISLQLVLPILMQCERIRRLPFLDSCFEDLVPYSYEFIGNTYLNQTVFHSLKFKKGFFIGADEYDSNMVQGSAFGSGIFDIIWLFIQGQKAHIHIHISRVVKPWET